MNSIPLLFYENTIQSFTKLKSTMEILSHLSQIPLFADYFSSEELIQLEKELRLIRVPAMFNVYDTNGNSDHVYIVLRGSVMIYDIKGDVKRIYTIVSRGDIFGESSLVGQKRNSFFADTREESDIFVIPKDLFIGILQQRPEMKLRMKEIILKRLQSQKDIIEAEIERTKKFEVAMPEHGIKEL